MYEALKEYVGEEAARMMAEALPLTDRVATKTDLDRVEERIVSHVDARTGAMEARIYRWMLGFFATLYLGTAGLIVTIVLKF